MTSETTELLFARYGQRYRWLVAITVLLGTMSATITTTTVNVAIPDIMGTFGIGQDRAQWLAAGALAGTTVAMLLSAWMIQSFGTRKTFVGALFVFVGALLLAGASPQRLGADRMQDRAGHGDRPAAAAGDLCTVSRVPA